MKTHTIITYSFNELDDCAKETARDHARSHWIFTDSSDWEYVLEDAVTVGALLGIQIATSRSVPSIYFDLYNRDCTITGTYRYRTGAVAAVRAYAPLDNALQGIAKALQAAQRPAFYSMYASLSPRGYRGSLQGVSVDSDRAIPAGASDALEDALVDFTHWIFDQLQAEHDYQMSDEAVDEMLISNDYQFNLEGKLQ